MPMIVFLTVLSVLLTVAVFIARVKSDFWIYKILEYPRMQKLVLVIATLAGWAFYWQELATGFKIVAGVLAISALYLAYKISPYTVITRREMKSIRQFEPGNSLKLF